MDVFCQIIACSRFSLYKALASTKENVQKRYIYTTTSTTFYLSLNLPLRIQYWNWATTISITLVYRKRWYFSILKTVLFELVLLWISLHTIHKTEINWLDLDVDDDRSVWCFMDFRKMTVTKKEIYVMITLSL